MKTKLENFTSDERSLLLYIECCAVDYGGLVDCRKINDDDRAILKKWDREGFISFSRITFKSLKTLNTKEYNHDLVRLSEDAWKLAHEERRARNVRMSAKPPYCDLITTKTKNSGFSQEKTK